MSDIHTDNRQEIIQKAKEHLLKATNIEDSEAEMQVLDNFLFRCWQMGWLKQYDSNRTKTRIEVLEDALDAMHQQYLSQVSMYKSMYEELKSKKL